MPGLGLLNLILTAKMGCAYKTNAFFIADIASLVQAGHPLAGGWCRHSPQLQASLLPVRLQRLQLPASELGTSAQPLMQ